MSALVRGHVPDVLADILEAIELPQPVGHGPEDRIAHQTTQFRFVDLDDAVGDETRILENSSVLVTAVSARLDHANPQITMTIYAGLLLWWWLS